MVYNFVNGRYFPHRQIIIINSNIILALINDITRLKVESSNDIAINTNDY